MRPERVAHVPPDVLAPLVALVQAGRHRELESRARDLLIRHPESGVLTKLLAAALWAQGKDALPWLARTTELLPEDAEAHSNLGNAQRSLGHLERAVSSHRRALELNPAYAEAHNNLGSALQDLGRLEEATLSFQRALTLRPEFALAHANLGNVLALQSRLEESEACSRRALELNPALTGSLVQLAEVQAGRGQFAAAEALLRRAIAIEPDMPEAWAGLVRWRRMIQGDSDWLREAQRIVASPLAPSREVHLRYALGKYFDDVADYAQAFANYQRANQLASIGRAAHDRRRVTEGMDRLIRMYDRAWVGRPRRDANRSERPVFIVGMPRSGTTLVEQILASQGTVFGAGELPFWNAAALRYGAARNAGKAAHGGGEAGRDAGEAGSDGGEAARNAGGAGCGGGGTAHGDGPRDGGETGLDGGESEDVLLASLAAEYLTLLRGLAADELRVVDKMPGNFLYLGLLHAALPQARIIHLRRNPIDTCLSIYFQNFGAAHSYANDLEDLAHYYGEYERIMDHWRTVLPRGTMLEVRYEELVEDAETWSRRMLEFVGLPWDGNCLEFHRNPRPVNTHSKWQARQKISGSSIGRWRSYERFLGPLLTLDNGRERAAADRRGRG